MLTFVCEKDSPDGDMGREIDREFLSTLPTAMNPVDSERGETSLLREDHGFAAKNNKIIK